MANPVELPLQEIITYVGLAAGTFLAAFLVRIGWRKMPRPESEMVVSGQAAIIDTGPIRSLLANVDLLVIQLQKSAEFDERRTIAIERLADTMVRYLAELAERQDRQDIESEIKRRVADEMKEHGIEPATQTIRRPPRQT